MPKTRNPESGSREFFPKRCSAPNCRNEKIFTKKHDFERHYRTHTQDSPFKCPYPGCGKVFKQKGQLNIHDNLHTGKEPFPCKQPGCGKTFKDPSTCARHVRDVHGDHADFRYFCPVEGCKRKMKRRTEFKTHVVTMHDIDDSDIDYDACYRQMNLDKREGRPEKAQNLDYSAGPTFSLPAVDGMDAAQVVQAQRDLHSFLLEDGFSMTNINSSTQVVLDASDVDAQYNGVCAGWGGDQQGLGVTMPLAEPSSGPTRLRSPYAGRHDLPQDQPQSLLFTPIKHSVVRIPPRQGESLNVSQIPNISTHARRTYQIIKPNYHASEFLLHPNSCDTSIPPATLGSPRYRSMSPHGSPSSQSTVDSLAGSPYTPSQPLQSATVDQKIWYSSELQSNLCGYGSPDYGSPDYGFPGST